MTNRNVSLSLCLILLAFFVAAPPAVLASGESNPTREQLVEIGRKVYREGLLANGEAAKATVMENIEVRGTQFTCINCHRRSGMGGPEGTKFVLATNGPSLYSPRLNLYLKRPAYTDQTLVEALALGKNPLGDQFDPVMPLYDLPDLEMDGLIAYLKTLSSEFSPGVDEEVIHLATVIDTAVRKEDREAMLGVLELFFAEKNAGTRKEARRAESAPFYMETHYKPYRQWVLHVWELKGPRESWADQLADHYRRQPVFAMISGMVNGGWEPIHRFCEENEVPSLLPHTDLPVIEKNGNFYTLYYSKGLTLEAEIALEAIEEESTPRTVLQLYREDSTGAEAARIFAGISDKKLTSVRDLPFTSATTVPDWPAICAEAERTGADAVMLWLSTEELSGLKDDAENTCPDLRVYLSSSLLREETRDIPGRLGRSAFLLQPFSLEADRPQRFMRVEQWLKARGIPLTRPRIQGEAYYACLLLAESLMHIRSYFYRDYLLDMIDHSQRMEAYVTNYPRISFGPEQRYLAKGAYIVDLRNGSARWIVPYR